MLLPVAFLAAAAGDSVGYAFGARTGPVLYRRPDSRVFQRKHLERATEFYARRGGSTIVLARFIPYVRTFAPIVAGAAGMPYRRFVASTWSERCCGASACRPPATPWGGPSPPSTATCCP